LSQLPVRNQEELVAVARRDSLGPRDTSAFVDLWRRTTDPEARQYLIEQPKAALELARGTRPEPAEPRLPGEARRLLSALVVLTQVALRVQRGLSDGPGAVPPEGLDLLRHAHREADQHCTQATGAMKRWLDHQEAAQ
jgi:hypothetical protein